MWGKIDKVKLWQGRLGGQDGVGVWRTEGFPWFLGKNIRGILGVVEVDKGVASATAPSEVDGIAVPGAAVGGERVRRLWGHCFFGGSHGRRVTLMVSFTSVFRLFRGDMGSIGWHRGCVRVIWLFGIMCGITLETSTSSFLGPLVSSSLLKRLSIP